MIAMLAFLARNDAMLIADDDELLEFSLAVADDRLDREASIEFVERRVVRLSESTEAFQHRLSRMSAKEAEALLSALRRMLGDDSSRAFQAFRTFR